MVKIYNILATDKVLLLVVINFLNDIESTI